MSQATATARPLPSPARAPRRTSGPAPLRVIPARVTTTGNGMFASACVVLMVVGLIALLLLNTALAKGSIELGKLQHQSAMLAEQAGHFQEQIDAASASGALAKRASELGMVRSNERGYIDVQSGKVTGTAYPANRFQAFQVITSPTPVPKPKPSPKPTAKASQQPATGPTGTPVPPSAASATPAAAGATPTATATGTLAPTGQATSPPPARTSQATQPSQPTQSPQPTTAR